MSLKYWVAFKQNICVTKFLVQNFRNLDANYRQIIFPARFALLSCKAYANFQGCREGDLVTGERSHSAKTPENGPS